MSDDAPILLFDGVCNFCNGAINFVIEHDRQARFRFASLQSEVGLGLLERHGLVALSNSTIVLVHRGRVYVRSDAVLRTAQLLGGGFRLLTPLRFVPRPLRDACYRALAKHRYRLFGRSEQCRLPSPELRARFLDMV